MLYMWVCRGGVCVLSVQYPASVVCVIRVMFMCVFVCAYVVIECVVCGYAWGVCVWCQSYV